MTRSADVLLFQSVAVGALLVMPHPYRSARTSQNNVNRIMGAWTCDLHGHGAAAWLGREIAWQGRSLRGNDSVSMILLLGRSRGRLSAEPATPANAGGAFWFHSDRPWPGIAELCRSPR